jgi:4-hydroxy-3-methylbut-2-en-1-yl diphosphate reductase
VDEVLEQLADAGYGTVDEVRTAHEDLMFSLPKELRVDADGNPTRALGGRNR